MHIEKINDNQIKCILSQRDLLARELDLSELAYGTEKARSLFHEMIEQAHDAFGFEAENTPLMVEAIPVSKESIVLIITRIDTPDELDTRFSRFSSLDIDDMIDEDHDSSNGADDILDLFRSSLKKNTQYNDETGELVFSDSDDEETKLQDIQNLSSHLAELVKSCSHACTDADVSEDDQSVTDSSDILTSSADQNPVNLMRIYSFDNLDDLLELSRILHPIYNGVNSLYKDESSSIYYLAVYQSHHTPSDFNKTCNMLSEYGERIKGSHAREAYCMEHYNCIVSQTALQRLYLF